ncbi:MAG: glycosyltransferase family 2 protein [Bacteroidales bacterium]|nr:glycosyltransferase family 2 protein [Bacteroidales bacterium]MCF8387066.1 glycosyltransferase family 2 protein [Bacteroidales bacterium]MCF8397754.1 glycosyltransferase family 2 protein [Bacteroidales bacterium]
MIKLSVVIITFNEEKNIRRCLESVRDVADEIIVVDSHSNDKTRDICLEYNVCFHQNKFKGYIEQKNFANKLASHDHILSMDADEALSERLRKSILLVKENWQYDAYFMNRLTNYCGKWIRHSGWYPDRKIRLFDRRKAKWDGKKIHEKLFLEKGSKTAFLEGELLHYSFYSIEQHSNQINKFSGIKAEVMFEDGKRSSVCKIVCRPFFTFIQNYLFKLGFLDGLHGYLICRNSAHSTFLKYSKLYKLQKAEKQKSTL